jgi:two-component system, NarL family, response regulator YdfI
MTRVFVVCGAEALRRGLESLVRASPSLEMVGSSATLSALGTAGTGAAPDVVLIAPESGLDEVLQTAGNSVAGEMRPQPAFVVLASAPILDVPRPPLGAGIRALLPVHASAEEIVAAISAAAAGLIALHPSMVQGGQRPWERLRQPVPQLSGRERQILTLLAEGLGNKEIAWQLRISEHTVKFHISSIFNKLDVSSRAEAVSLGFRFGLILV